MNADADRGPAAPMVVFAGSARDLIEFHWLLITHTQNIVEDIDGNDGRVEYLRGLAMLLIPEIHEAASCLAGDHGEMHWCHRLAQAMEDGLPRFPGISGDALEPYLLSGGEGIADAKYEQSLRDLVALVQDRLPGELPATLGPKAQRAMLRSLREWSALAADVGEDIGFLEDRLRYL